ncbi:unnamed protein product [Clonostachys rosea f. rosea IK726]|uniref:Uncharacterized protein n=1 Tax=Clonostachys rosea f. rosea IK726 TaxID=1349383 RepID=A0ACA9TBE5_BIOOC|nr:unnamed protein product [Clonostachys rosea f. rosea IK726]
MERIKEKIKEDRKRAIPYANPISLITSQGRSDLADPELLPCYFFDFMVGTSTGGLIAVMLGRLRMSVDDAIKAYWNLGANIFPPGVILPSQRRERLKKAINSVIQSHCLCHQDKGPCVGEEEELRQHDYAEFSDHNYPKDKRNLTCKAALVAQKRGGDSNEVYLFRTYNNKLNKHGIQVPNAKLLDEAKLAIWKACCASTASRKHFGVMVIKDAQYIDGGADNNNPSGIALNEARAMSRSTEPKVAAMISLGCGEKIKPGWLGGSPFTIATLKALTRRVTDTEKTHQNTQMFCQEAGTPYFRFNVKPYQGNSGLKKIKMDHRKKKSKQPWWMFGGHRQITGEKEMPSWYQSLQSGAGASNNGNHDSDVSAGSKSDQQQRSGFDSNKYFYSTYNTIFMETMKYCEVRHVGTHEQKVSDEIDKCAEVLLAYARTRYRDHSERWKCFISHPDSRHPQYITSGYRRNGDEP